MITQERLKELLSYDPETGIFTWKVKWGRKVRIIVPVGYISNRGYRCVHIDGKHFLLSRLAWLYMHGYLPVHQIDHRDGIRDNDRINNLREATNAENCQNTRKYKTNTSGYKGVHWNKQVNKWQARIKINKKCIHLGYFTIKEDASEAYLKAKKKFHTFNPVPREEVVQCNQ